MTRPLERLGIAELEAFLKKPGITSGDLKDLKEELSFRTTSRSEKLLKTVKSRIKIDELISNAKSRLADKKSVQMELPSVSEFALTEGAPGPSAQLAMRPTVPAPVTTASPPTAQTPLSRSFAEPIQVMASEQAFKVLKVAPSATWEQIEHSRRALVAKGQPDRLAGLSAEKRRALQDECKQVNAAYKALLQLKG